MRILLIRSSEIGSFGSTNITGIYPPLGLAYIASVLKNAGFQVGFLDNQVLRLQGISLKKEIKKNNPDVVLLSAMTPQWQQIRELSKIIKDISAKIIVGVGGPHLTVYPKESLSDESFDFGVYGEGEKTVLEIMRNIQNGKGFDGIKGCIFRKNGQVMVNPPREEIDDLDALPFPAVGLLPFKDYFALSVKRPFFSMVTSRGCPYTCRFCFQGYLGRYRSRSPENVVEEMEQLVNKYNIREIIIFDETFAVETPRALAICELVRKKNLKFSWDLRTRVDLLNEELLISLKAAGCARLHLGIESGNEEVLSNMAKGISIPQIIEKVDMAKRLGFQLRGYFMLGFPGEGRESISDTIRFAKSLPLDWASFTVTIGLPETYIYNESLKKGYFSGDYWREQSKGKAVSLKPYFIPQGMTGNELFDLKRKAYLDFYLRPRIIRNILKNYKFTDTFKNFRIFFNLLPSMYRSFAGAYD